ncbi:MAG: hypothetical protein PSV46_28240 [Reyranella sp.]|nr:hypothetical protein [Reyranella sp.]
MDIHLGDSGGQERASSNRRGANYLGKTMVKRSCFIILRPVRIASRIVVGNCSVQVSAFCIVGAD